MAANHKLVACIRNLLGVLASVDDMVVIADVQPVGLQAVKVAEEMNCLEIVLDARTTIEIEIDQAKLAVLGQHLDDSDEVWVVPVAALGLRGQVRIETWLSVLELECDHAKPSYVDCSHLLEPAVGGLVANLLPLVLRNPEAAMLVLTATDDEVVVCV